MNIFLKIYALDYWVLFAIMVAAIGVFALIEKILKKQKWFGNLCGVGFIVFTIFILWFTVLRRIGTANAEYHLNLIPFRSYYIGLTENEEGFRTCFMNAVLFAPLGCLYFGYNRDNKIKPLHFILFAFALSLFVETMQFIFKLGYTEVDDLIHNILGAAFGYGVCVIFSKLYNRIGKNKI